MTHSKNFTREDAQPVAWSFELATVRDRETGEYSSWGEPRLSFTKPCVPEGSIRNLTALGPITHPAPDALRVAVEALEWYGEQARLARLIHSEGDAGRHALADDGGKRARQALAVLQAEQEAK